MDLSAINGVVLIPLVLLVLIFFDWIVTSVSLDDPDQAEEERK